MSSDWALTDNTVGNKTADGVDTPSKHRGAVGDNTAGNSQPTAPETTGKKEVTPPAKFPERVKLPSAKVEEGRLIVQGTEAEQAGLCAAFASGSADFQSYCIAQLLGILPGKQKTDDYSFLLNSALAMLAGIAPQDEFEAMLAVQMIAAHHASIEMTGYAVRTDRMDSKQLNGNLANKFSRTFAALSETLDRHRRGGKQIVEHVHVNEGGQAVIAGIVNTGGRA